MTDELHYYYGDYEDEEYWEDEEETCPEGFAWDECCECVTRFGIEFCEFLCPFKAKDKEIRKKAIRFCYSEACDKILEEFIEAIKEAEKEEVEPC